MNLSEYDLVVKPGSLNFEFVSEGPRGRIKKVIEFKEIATLKDAYNLGFGDYLASENRVDDLVVSRK